MRILYLPHQYSQQRQREKRRWIYPVLMTMEAESYHQQGHEVYWDTNDTLWETYDKVIQEPEGLPFLSLPHPDRVFTSAKNPIYQNNGNFKYLPGTYIQVANGCWWGKCTFCVEQNKPYEVREVDDVIEEIKEIKRLGFREVFDDSGTFPMGDWLNRFCDKFSAIGGLRFSCNFRMVDCDYDMLHKANFRMLLFGLESANQSTLDKINKGVKIEEAIKVIKKANKAGLESHIAVMFGYPWENDNDAISTLRLVHYLLKKGYAKTAQASFYTPQEGEQGKSEHRKYVKKIYNVSRNLEFWFNKLRNLHDRDDLAYLWRQIKAGINDIKL